MRLDFNILWVEDQADDVRATRDALTRRIGSEGFQMRPTLCATVAEVEGKLADNVFTDEIDLVLVDWELGSGDRGQDAIETIRERIAHKDIIFYSSLTDTQDLRRLAFEKQLGGLYFAHRNDLVEEVVGVFDSLVKKALDLDHIRGIVMGATSDIDQLVREALSYAHDRCEPEEQERIIEEMVQLLDAKVPNLKKRVDKLKKNPAIASLLKAHLTFTANDGLRILDRILGLDAFVDQAAYRDALQRYIQDVVPKRNILGHRVLLPDNKPGIAGIDEGEHITFEELKELRQVLLSLRERFRALHGSLLPRVD